VVVGERRDIKEGRTEGRTEGRKEKKEVNK
jgi:hypothetical protein